MLMAVWWLALAGLAGGGCDSPGTLLHRRGDEMVVAGQYFHTGTRVVLWTDPGGYDAYRVERRFVPLNKADWEDSKTNFDGGGKVSPNRYGLRTNGLSQEEIERVRGGGWDLALLRRHVDQLVLHFDAAGTARACFKTLQDQRDLSTHFLLDLDGTVYQTMDAKEKGWHATTSNDRSIGVEIANVGAYTAAQKSPFANWYRTESDGRTRITIPASAGLNPERRSDFAGRPVRRRAVAGTVQGEELNQYDFTAEQYHALARLTAALCTVLPGIRCDYPRDAAGRLLTSKMADGDLRAYRGVLGHYHIQTNKVDPGPALQWDYVVGEARRLMKQPVLPRDAEGGGMVCRPDLIRDN